MRQDKGVLHILENVCKLTKEDTLLENLILEKVELLKQKGWIKEKH